MTATILITLCSLLLMAYLFDLTSSLTKIPSVLLLLLLGWLVREASQFFEIKIPSLSGLLPFFGTVGLILIVLDGALELEFNASKTKVIKRSFLLAVVPITIMAFFLALVFMYMGAGVSFKDSLMNAVPFCVISSSVAISSVKNLSSSDSEFIIYESSFSDILGVLFFNFIALNSVINAESVLHFTLQLAVITAVSFAATIALSYLLGAIQHPIKFVPIILLVMLIYAVSEVFHLQALIFIMLFGLFLGNLNVLNRNKWLLWLKPRKLRSEVRRFKELIAEATFLIKAMFFLLFGYVLRREEITNPETILIAVGIVIAVFLFRLITIRILKLPINPLFFIAPRGLITILLFLAIAPDRSILFINRSLVIQVIILTSLVMMGGFMFKSKVKDTTNLEMT